MQRARPDPRLSAERLQAIGATELAGRSLGQPRSTIENRKSANRNSRGRQTAICQPHIHALQRLPLNPLASDALYLLTFKERKKFWAADSPFDPFFQPATAPQSLWSSIMTNMPRWVQPLFSEEKLMANALAPEASCIELILLEIRVPPVSFKKFRTLSSSSPLWSVIGFSYVKLLARNIWVLFLAKYMSPRDGL
jgi:hypothetical protein